MQLQLSFSHNTYISLFLLHDAVASGGHIFVESNRRYSKIYDKQIAVPPVIN